jgi:hypothetical protein
LELPGVATVRQSRALAVTTAYGVVAICSKGVEREVEWYDVLGCRPEVERRPVAVATERLPMGHPYAQRRVPGASVIERVAQRLSLEVPDPSAARRVHALLIPSRRTRNSPFGRARAICVAVLALARRPRAGALETGVVNMSGDQQGMDALIRDNLRTSRCRSGWGDR